MYLSEIESVEDLKELSGRQAKEILAMNRSGFHFAHNLADPDPPAGSGSSRINVKLAVFWGLFYVLYTGTYKFILKILWDVLIDIHFWGEKSGKKFPFLNCYKNVRYNKKYRYLGTCTRT